jgi:hypothetical protein
MRASVTMKSLLLALIALCSLSALGSNESRIWREHGVAAVTVGADPANNELINRKFYLAVSGPSLTNEPNLAASANKCAAIVLPSVAEEFRIRLWDVDEDRQVLTQLKLNLPSSFNAFIGAAPTVKGGSREPEVTATLEQRYKRINKLVYDASLSLERHMAKCMGTKVILQFKLSIVQRECSTKQCSNVVPIFGRHPSAEGFETLAGWIRVRDSHNQTPPLNTLISLVVDPAKIDLGTNVIDANKWPAAPTRAEMQQQFEAGLRTVRRLNVRFSSTVPRTMEIPFEVAIRTLDAIDSPSQVIGTLRREAGAKLTIASDEIARISLRKP